MICDIFKNIGVDAYLHQSPTWLAFVRVTSELPAQMASNAEMYPFEDIIMLFAFMLLYDLFSCFMCFVCKYFEVELVNNSSFEC